GSRQQGPRRRRRRLPAQDDTAQVPIDRILAKPPVRKLARDLGVALADILATGPGGTVTREDVLAAQQRAYSGDTAAPDAHYFPEESPQAPEGLGGAMKTTRDQPFAGVTSDERTTRVPIRSVRKRTAEAMVASALTAPHVTVFNEIDMTRALQIVAQLRSSREWADVKVSPLAVIAKALLVAIRRNPEVNGSWDEDAQEIVYKHYVNLGIAAATPRGLIVPNLKDAHLMTLRELAEGIGELARTARAGRTSLRDTDRIAKALLVAIRRNPEVNGSWDEDAQEIVYKHYVNLGIAAATPRGLIVPNLKDAHLMTLRELAEGIGELARTARAGRTSLRD